MARPGEAAEGQARDQYQPSAIAQTTVANVVINSFTGRGSGACLRGDVCRRSVSQSASQVAAGHDWHGCMAGWLEKVVGGHLETIGTLLVNVCLVTYCNMWLRVTVELWEEDVEKPHGKVPFSVRLLAKLRYATTI